MKLTNTQWIIVAVLAAIVVWYFFLRKKDDAKESGYVSGGKKRPPGTKLCNCAYLKDDNGNAKPNKICSKDVFCNDCCEGAGTGDHTGAE